MKKFLSCLIAVILCLSVFPVSAFADDYELTVSATSEELFACEADFDAVSYIAELQSDIVKNDEISAAFGIRDNLINRVKDFTVVLTTDRNPDSFSDIVKNLYMLATDEKLADTPKAGDYLRYQIGQYTCSAGLDYDGRYYTYYIHFEVNYYTDYEQEEKMDKEVELLILSLINANDTEYARVKKIYDYICGNIVYDYENLNDSSYMLKHTAYAALFNKTAVCQGYAVLFYRLAREAGLDVRIISNDDHSWNIVKIGNMFYNVDATWDSALKQVNAEYIWFLRNMKNFEHADHIRATSFGEEFSESHPMSATDYDSSHESVDTHIHTLSFINVKAEDCGRDGYTGDIICSECHKLLKEGSIISATGNHDYKSNVVKEATCASTGLKAFKCSVCGDSYTETLDKLQHKPVIDQVIAPTCTAAGKTQGSHCVVCGEIIDAQKAVSAAGHKWDSGEVTTAATCTQNGTKTYTCTVCGAVKTEDIEKLNHKAVVDKAVNPTCTEIGKTEGSHCERCNEILVAQKEIAPTGHTAKWLNINGALVKRCTVCNEELSRLPFDDLGDYDYYADYVEYTSSINKFITGTNPPERTLFSPTTSITRAMFVTILYRMAGEPYANSNPYKTSPFTDITDTGVYYYDAACWALDEKITNQTTFKPYDNVNREQTASFLFRYAQANNQLGNSDYKNVNLSKYADYRTVSSWAVEAMQWANYNGMITGTQQNTLNPQGATQRIHATKILYGFGKVCNIGNFE